jgi:hypothetical protein
MRKHMALRMRESLIEKIRDIAYWTPGMTITSFVEEALMSHIGQYERERGSSFPDRKAHKPNKVK